ncbi:unnamed protein product [Coffea canephora]|uniref:QWRF motif-containing protein 7 n=1 Tax=Coffea canephora TaxID=49390 RepID=A0A068UAN9_COFCA|nr:unnamed protein product [Coffea canephora]
MAFHIAGSKTRISKGIHQMENSSNGNTCHKKHHPFTNLTRSPPLLQSKSRPAPADAHMQAPNSRPALLNPSKSRSRKVQESTPTSRIDRKKLPPESRDDANKLLLRGQSKMDVPRRSGSASTSPSAWALSPGRSLHPPSPAPRRPLDLVSKSKRDPCSDKGSSGVGGVLKYLGKKIKKASRLQEEEHHRCRIIHNALLQWRFVNARAQVSTTAVKGAAQKKLFNFWLKGSIMKNAIAGKRIQLQRLNQQIKLYHILRSEFCLLKEWARLEIKNREAAERLATKLSAMSRCLPLDQGAKADVTSLLDWMIMATRVIENIGAKIANIQAQVERLCYMLTELSVIANEEKDCAIMLEKNLATLASLAAQETSLRLHSIQLDEESRRFNSAILTP